MSVEALRAYLPNAEVVGWLDAALAGMVPEPVDHDLGLPAALAQLAEREFVDGGFAERRDPLARWILGFAAICAAESRFDRYRVKPTIARLAAMPAFDVLLHLASSPATPVRVAVYGALADLESAGPAVVAALVRGVADGSAKVRASAIGALAQVPNGLAELGVAQAGAKGKARTLIGEAIAMLAPSASVPAVSAAAPGLLGELVAVWQATHQPEVADLIDVVASQLPRAPIAGRSAAEREVQWHVAAEPRSPATLSALLATPWPAKWRDARARLDVLRTWCDPRIAAALRATLEAPPYHSDAAISLYIKLLADLSAIPDARQLAPLHALRAALDKLFGGYTYLADVARGVSGAALEAALAAHPAQAYGSHEVTIQRARAALTGAATSARTGARTDAELLAEIYATPESDAARMVYADFLSDRGDPRGELITLQCARARGDGTAEMLRRERALITQHEAQLVGPLAPYVRHEGRVFERGFLAACRCEARAFTRGAREVAWATIRAITFTDHTPSALAAMLGEPQGAALRVLHGLSQEGLEALASERIVELGYTLRGPAIASLPKLPNLERLAIRARSQWSGHPDVDALIAGDLWPRLTHLTMSGGFEDLARWLARFVAAPRLAELVVLSHATELIDEPVGWSIAMRQGTPPVLVARLHTGDPFEAPFEALEALPIGAATLEIADSRPLASDPDSRAGLVAVQQRLGGSW